MELIAHADIGVTAVTLPLDADSWKCNNDVYRWATSTVYWQLRAANNDVCARRWMSGYVSFVSGMPQVPWSRSMAVDVKQPSFTYMNPAPPAKQTTAVTDALQWQ